MNLTLAELKERLASKHDEITLLELLNISSEDLINAFEDRILDRIDSLVLELESDEEFMPEEFRQEEQ